MKLKYFIFSIITLALIITAFLFGQHWHATYYSYLGSPKDTFTCFSHSNFFENYQTNCTLPVEKKPFTFKNRLECQAFSNHQFIHNNDQEQSREQTMMIKADSVKFTLDFKEETIVRSLDIGTNRRIENYTILKNSNGVIQAMRPMKEENLDKEGQYEFITFSKNTGHGMEVWHNVLGNVETEPWRNDSIASHFFKCK